VHYESDGEDDSSRYQGLQAMAGGTGAGAQKRGLGPLGKIYKFTSNQHKGRAANPSGVLHRSGIEPRSPLARSGHQAGFELPGGNDLDAQGAMPRYPSRNEGTPGNVHSLGSQVSAGLPGLCADDFDVLSGLAVFAGRDIFTSYPSLQVRSASQPAPTTHTK